MQAELRRGCRPSQAAPVRQHPPLLRSLSQYKGCPRARQRAREYPNWEDAMTSGEMAAPGLSDAEHSAQLRRAIIASTVGTVTEAYDFLLYVLVAPLVFAKSYFPASDPLTGTLQAFAIYAVGFVARPVGATKISPK